MAFLRDRLLETLESLLALPAADLKRAMIEVSNLIAGALGADKVDAFLYDASRDTLVAVGSSQQPLSQLQHRHGLHILPVSNGGRTVRVFQTGKTYLNRHVEQDSEELLGIRETLGVRSNLGVPLDVAGKRRGMIMVASQKPEQFDDDDARFMENVARWVGVIAHRAELVEEIARNAAEQGRRAAAEELITIFAHDMRNQLGPITTRLSLLQRRAERESAAWALRDVELMQRSLQRLGSLATDILDVARLDRGLMRIQPQPIDLALLLEDVVATGSTPDHPIELHIERGQQFVVPADPARVRQCLENLVSNATGHSPQGTQVLVTAEKRRDPDGSRICVEIIDQGPGVPPEIASQIFDAYTTGEPGRGLGLGLYLAKSIAELHGGDLAVDLAPRRGARFILRLPCATGDCTR